MLTDSRLKLAHIVAIAALVAYSGTGSTAESPIAKDDHSPTEFEVKWLGGPTMTLRFGHLTLLTDPTLGDEFAMGDPNDPKDPQTIRAHRRLTPLINLDLRAVDLVVLSHIHPDHFDQEAVARLDRAIPVIVPPDDVAAVRAKGFSKVDGLGWGETRQFDAGAGQLRITAVAANHSHDPKIGRMLGKGNGYWIELSAGPWKRSVYWTGDSMATSEVIDAVKLHGAPDLLVPHVGGVGSNGPFGQISMRGSDVVALAAAVRPKYVLPIHHSTYEFYREPISELVRQSSGKFYRLDLIAAGSAMVYE